MNQYYDCNSYTIEVDNLVVKPLLNYAILIIFSHNLIMIIIFYSLLINMIMHNYFINIENING